MQPLQHVLSPPHVIEVPVPEAASNGPLDLLDRVFRQPPFVLQTTIALRRGQPPGQRLAPGYGLH